MQAFFLHHIHKSRNNIFPLHIHHFPIYKSPCMQHCNPNQAYPSPKNSPNKENEPFLFFPFAHSHNPLLFSPFTRFCQPSHPTNMQELLQNRSQHKLQILCSIFPIQPQEPTCQNPPRTRANLHQDNKAQRDGYKCSHQ